MNTPNNKRRKNSQEKIEKTFIQLIQTKEIENISVSDICKIAKLNRSTFYANYIDIYDLVEKVKARMENDFANVFASDFESTTNSDSYLKMFRHIKDNQIFYRTYFKINFDTNTSHYPVNKKLTLKYYDDTHIDYHVIFFKAAFTALIKKWLNNNCKESPEVMLEILESEYKKKC